MNPIQKIETTQFKAADKENILSINVSIDGLSFIILNNKTIVKAEAYEWQHKDWNYTYTKVSEVIKHEIFSNTFNKVFCFLQNSSTCLIPDEYFIQGAIKKALETYLGKNIDEAYYTKLKNADINLVYGIDTNLIKLISSILSEPKFIHSSSIYIDLALQNINTGQQIYLNIGTQEFEIIGIKDGKLISHNYFQFNTIDEFLFLLLSFVKQNSFNTETLYLNIKGKILKSSKLSQTISKYFNNINLDKTADNKHAIFETLKNHTLFADN